MTCSRPQRNVHRPGFEQGTPWSEIRRLSHCATPLLFWNWTEQFASDSSQLIDLPLGYGVNAFLIFMSSYKGLGPKKQFWPIRMKLSKPFRRQLFQYAENLLHGLLSNIHRINCPTPACRTKSRPFPCCVISLAQYM